MRVKSKQYTVIPYICFEVANGPTVGRLVRGLAGRQLLHRAADWSRSLDVIQLPCRTYWVVRIGGRLFVI